MQHSMITQTPVKLLIRLTGIALFGIAFSIVLTVTNPLQRGLIGQYYSTTNWSGEPILTTHDAAIDLARLQRAYRDVTRQYSIRWKGFIHIDTPGDHQFITISDDGSDLWIAGRQIVDNTGQHGAQEKSGTIFLEKGVYPIAIRYVQERGDALFETYWIAPGHARQPLGAAPLFSTEPSAQQIRSGNMLTTAAPLGLLICVLCGGALVLMGIRHASFLASCLPQIMPVLLIFLVVVIVNVFGCRISSSFDSRWSVHTALSMLKEGNTDLNEYQQLIEQDDYYAILRHGDRMFTVYPVGTSFLALPYVAALESFYKRTLALDLEEYISAVSPRGIEIFIASNIVAFTTILLYLLGNLFFQKRSYSLGLAAIFAFATPMWSTATRALWQHGPTALMLMLAVYLFALAQRYRRHAASIIPLISIPLAFSFVIRPTNSISILMLTLVVFVQYRRYFVRYCLWSLLIIIPLLAYNFNVYDAWLPPYYTAPNQLHIKLNILDGLLGTLFSPSRGVFMYTPVLIFSLLGICLKIRQKRMQLFDYALLAILLLHWGITSVHPHWWGGHSYGPRYFTDVLPYFFYFLIPTLQWFSQCSGLKRVLGVSVFFCAVLVSFMIHMRGVTSWEVYYWNSLPVNVDKNPARVWDWRDIQFLRGIGQ